jgi:uncharacterized protein (TIGR00730 family)
MTTARRRAPRPAPPTRSRSTGAPTRAQLAKARAAGKKRSQGARPKAPGTLQKVSPRESELERRPNGKPSAPATAGRNGAGNHRRNSNHAHGAAAKDPEEKPRVVIARSAPLPVQIPKPLEDEPEADERIARIMASPSYRRADQDPDFMDLDELRGERLELEYLKAEIELRRQDIRSTIVVFGSTRLVEPAAARRKLEAARRDLDRNPKDPVCQRRVSVAERVVHLSRYYVEARELGRIVSRVCQQGGPYQFVVMTGGGPGIMEAANRGAFDVGAKTVGLNIILPHEQYPNPYITPDLCFQYRYFALRKMHFMMRARALVAFPGGYGTFDEVFDALCLIQTQKIPPLPVVLVGREFWRKAFDAEFLASEGVIDPEDMHLFRYAETGQEAWEHIVEFWRGFGEHVIP